MKRLTFYIVACSIVLSLNCTQKNVAVNEPYIISEQDRILASSQELLPPRPGFYGLSNIIIDKKGDFYFYQRKYRMLWNCVQEENALPEFIALEPKDLVHLPKNSIIDFLKCNTATEIKERKAALMIASQSDTIRSQEFLKLLDFLQNTKESGIALYNIRSSTHEEDIVLQFKSTNAAYNPDSIKWDKSRITLFD